MFTAKIQWETIMYGVLLRWLLRDGTVIIVKQYTVQISDSQKYGTQNYNIIYKPFTHNNLQC